MTADPERRRHLRFRLPCRLVVELDGEPPVRCRAGNVSNTGVFFITPDPPPVGAEVRLRLAVPRETANTFFLEQFSTRARVVRHEQGPGPLTGVSLEFLEPLALDLQ